MFLERFDFELHDIYRALSHFSKIGLECQQFICKQIFKKFGKDTTLMYFNVTNFHFEIDVTYDMRKYVATFLMKSETFSALISLTRGFDLPR